MNEMYAEQIQLRQGGTLVARAFPLLCAYPRVLRESRIDFSSRSDRCRLQLSESRENDFGGCRGRPRECAKTPSETEMREKRSTY